MLNRSSKAHRSAILLLSSMKSQNAVKLEHFYCQNATTRNNYSVETSSEIREDARPVVWTCGLWYSVVVWFGVAACGLDSGAGAACGLEMRARPAVFETRPVVWLCLKSYARTGPCKSTVHHLWPNSFRLVVVMIAVVVLISIVSSIISVSATQRSLQHLC